tara:strand:- start:464 stop:754 length:291 start_codon:yes stop_codon:yes gene_type:complete
MPKNGTISDYTHTKLVKIISDLTPAQSDGGGGAPTDAQYLVLAVNGDLSAERVLAEGTGIALVDGGAGAALTISSTVTQVDADDADQIIAHQVLGG